MNTDATDLSSIIKRNHTYVRLLIEFTGMQAMEAMAMTGE